MAYSDDPNAASSARLSEFDRQQKLANAITGAAVSIGVGAGSASSGDSNATDRRILRSYVTQSKDAVTNTYSFPTRIVPAEPFRRTVIVRNISSVAIQVAFSVNDNGNFNSPGSRFGLNPTIPAGSEWVAPLFSGQALFARPNVSGDPLFVGVYSERAVR